MPYFYSSYLLKYSATEPPVGGTQFVSRLGSNILNLLGLSTGEVEENALKEATVARYFRARHSQSLH